MCSVAPRALHVFLTGVFSGKHETMATGNIIAKTILECLYTKLGLHRLAIDMTTCLVTQMDGLIAFVVM